MNGLLCQQSNIWINAKPKVHTKCSLLSGVKSTTYVRNVVFQDSILYACRMEEWNFILIKINFGSEKLKEILESIPSFGIRLHATQRNWRLPAFRILNAKPVTTVTRLSCQDATSALSIRGCQWDIFFHGLRTPSKGINQRNQKLLGQIWQTNMLCP